MTSGLKIQISSDGVSIAVTGEAPGLCASEAEDRIRMVLTRAGVVDGNIDAQIQHAAHMLAANGSIPSIVVARVSRQCAFPGLKFNSVVYDSRILPPSVVSSGSILHAQLCETLIDPVLVHAGQCVGICSEPSTRDGAEGGPSPSIRSGKGPAARIQGALSVLPNGDIVARATGILVSMSGNLFLLPVNVHGGFRIEISPDNLSADLLYFPAGPGGVGPGLGDIRRNVESMGIRTVDYCGIRTFLAQAATAGTTQCRITIARGEPPIKGEDGRIEFLVDLEFSHRPAIREDGRADYYSVHQFETVVKGQSLVRLHKPRHGTSGIDIYGKSIPARPGTPAALRFGKGVGVSPREPSVLIAIRDGHVYMRTDTMIVEEVLRVHSGIDFKTGNIQFPGDVVISGDVRSGFSVRANGSIRIQGAVEDAVVIAGKHVIVGAGFLGQGRGVIRAGGDVVVAFVRNQTIESRGSIMIASEAIDARLCAGVLVRIESRKSRIVGGEVVARSGVVCANLGGESGPITRCAVGIDSFVLKRKCVAETRLSRLEEELERLMQERDGPAKSEGARSVAGRGSGLRYARLLAAIEDLGEKADRFRESVKELDLRAYQEGARIRVAGEVHPGVIVEIARHYHTVQHIQRGCEFFAHDNRIQMQLLPSRNTPSRPSSRRS